MKFIWQLSLSALSLGVGIFAIVEFKNLQAEREDIENNLTEMAIAERAPDLPGKIRVEADPSWARIWLARAVLWRELDLVRSTNLSTKEREARLARGLEMLEQMRQIAAIEWLQHPARWHAALALGGTTHLLWSRAGDPRLTSERSRWELPLLAANSLGVDEVEPARFLAAGYLGGWSTLSLDERDRAAEVLRKAFTEPDTFNLLVERWLRVAPDLQAAYSVVPETSEAWAKLAEIYKQRQDLERQRHAEAKHKKLLTTVG
jgi:hypothetical protein